MDIVISKFKEILNPVQFEKLAEIINILDCDNSVKLKNLQSLFILIQQSYFKFDTCLEIFKKNCTDSNSDFLNKAYCYVISKEVKKVMG